MICSSYHTLCLTSNPPIYVGECWGTKEKENCKCGGEESKCDFYPEKREAALAAERPPIEQKTKCPFRKHIIYEANHNTGAGYPDIWEVQEDFDDCIGEACAAFGRYACNLCQKSLF